ncbi:MAG: TIGR04002 family protein [Clostridia bacterium]|nr:TIGR04002 family protein [Clostridia bacterium]
MKRNIVLVGVLAAMVCVATGFLHIPIVGGGYVHLGDTVIYLAAAMLPAPYAMAAAAVGAGLADLLVAPVWAPFTVVIKAVMVLAFTAKNERLLCRRNTLAPLIAGVIGVAGYYIAEVAIFWLSGGEFVAVSVAALAAVPFNALQELAGGVAFLLLAAALDRLEIRKRLKRM